MDSDDGFMMYRRFGYLQSRLLLEKQARLCQLENQLDKLDRSQTSGENNMFNLCSLDLFHDLSAPRQKLMREIEGAFLEYGITALSDEIGWKRQVISSQLSIRNTSPNIQSSRCYAKA
jgi:hypothetical protein